MRPDSARLCRQRYEPDMVARAAATICFHLISCPPTVAHPAYAYQEGVSLVLAFIGWPIGQPALLLRDVVTTLGVGLEGHGGYPDSERGRPSISSCFSAIHLVRGPNSRGGSSAVESRKGAVSLARPVSPPRSSNRTCGFPASGFPTGFTARPTLSRPPRAAYAQRAESLRLATQLV